MTYSPEDRDAIRAMLRRAAIVAADDGGTQQLLDLSGLASEQLKKIVHVQPFGLSSNPPVGGEGVLLSPGGRADRAMFFGGEHKDHRPKNLPMGAVAIYDAFGDILEFVETSVRLVHAAKITLQAPIIVLDGAVQITGAMNGASGTGAISIGSVINSTANINTTANVSGADVLAGGKSGKNHVHGGVQSGGSNTGAPI